MQGPIFLLVIDGTLAAWVAFDLLRTLKTGRAAGRFGVATRAHQPARYWRYVYASYGVLAVCLGLFCWVVLSPDTFR